MKPYYKNYYSNNKRFSMDKWKEKKEKIIDNSFNIENLDSFPYLNTINKDINKDINEDINKDINEDINEDINKDINEDINEDINKKSWLKLCYENIDKPIIEKKINIIKKNNIIKEDNIIVEDNELIKTKIKINKKNILNDDGSFTIVKNSKFKSINKEIIQLSDNNIYLNENSFIYKNISKNV